MDLPRALDGGAIPRLKTLPDMISRAEHMSMEKARTRAGSRFMFAFGG